jgi:hypothetical protein
MKHWNVWLAAAALTVAGAVMAQAQPGPGMGRMYDPKTETTIKGSVDEVTQGTRGMWMGTHLMVKTPEATVEVMLGPKNFLTSKGFSFAKGDEVEITGSKVKTNDKEYVIAREVVKGGKTLTLRDKTGRPEWAGTMGGRGSMPCCPPQQ